MYKSYMYKDSHGLVKLTNLFPHQFLPEWLISGFMNVDPSDGRCILTDNPSPAQITFNN